jgi:hypothetical protein
VGAFWEPPAIDAGKVRVYGNDTFCLVLQQKLNLNLIAPRDDLIFAVSAAGTRRSLARHTIATARTPTYRLFAKPLTPKLFRARVYASADELVAECPGLPADTAILVSEVVEFSAEARSFVLDGDVLDCAVYEGEGETSTAAALVREIVEAIPGPREYVIDVGFITGRGWALVEFNAPWGRALTDVTQTA